MDLRITTTPALIGIQTNSAKIELHQQQADMQMNIEQPKLEIHTEQGKVQIDQYPCRAEEGLKNNIDLLKDTAVFAKQKAMQGIERIVRQGNQFAAIQNKTDAVAEQAEENAYHLFDKEFNFGSVPKSRPNIDFTGGNVEINVVEGKVNLQVKVNKPTLNYTRGNVEVYLRQKNSINIEYVGKKLNHKI
ncbi:DUF6470 family protein [Marinisporobacter balticus]|uniref:Uncharacterized protein n=1 Tax=Marinisporobacter balticus TaxID=2018667 RepID=A0A4R2L1N8_9FIRM|nr:DUF6470 family protein [Marinisporobacter balticus]TCO76468.1 hypothetical protein EV214_10870 [Marinisporobacter balticus]